MGLPSRHARRCFAAVRGELIVVSALGLNVAPGASARHLAFVAAASALCASRWFESGRRAFLAAESLGIDDFHMVPALNDSPLLIRALADLVLRAVGGRSGVASLAM